MNDLIVERPEGLYCPEGDFHIDPMRRVERAVITHAHSDHARSGHAHYLTHADGAELLRQRLGRQIRVQTLAYGETLTLGGVQISLHPAGHVLGSSQVRVEHRGQVWVVSGDYFVGPTGERNPTCPPFEPVRCDCFITESTFAQPIYRWPAAAGVFEEIHAWWALNASLGRPSVLQAYSLGKAQRVLADLDASLGPIAVHGTVAGINAAYAAAGVQLPACVPIESLGRDELRRALVIAPPNALQGLQALAANTPRCAFASGWMQVRKRRRQAGLDRGFVLSDHADWPGLLSAIEASEATRIIVTHGTPELLVRHLQEHGRDAGVFPRSREPATALAQTAAPTLIDGSESGTTG